VEKNKGKNGRKRLAKWGKLLHGEETLLPTREFQGADTSGGSKKKGWGRTQKNAVSTGGRQQSLSQNHSVPGGEDMSRTEK